MKFQLVRHLWLSVFLCALFANTTHGAGEIALPKQVKPGPVPAQPKVTNVKSNRFAIRRMASVDSAVNKVVSVGPSILVGLPHPLNFAINARFGHPFQVSLGGGSLSHTFSTSTSPVLVGVTNFEGRFRYFPFEGSFFCGVALGYQSLSGEGDVDVTVSSVTVPIHEKMTVKAPYLTPHLGWLWTWANGALFGLEMGAQFPVGGSTEVETTTNSTYANLLAQAKNTPTYKAAEADITNYGNKIGKQVFPLVTMIHFGWMFDI